MKSIKYILFLSLLWVCYACSITRDVPEGKFVVYENELQGIQRSDGEQLYGLLEQEPNTRFLGTSLGVNIYRFGKNFYDSAKVAEKLAEAKTELEVVQSTPDTLIKPQKLEKKVYKLNSKVESLKKKLDYGNGVMRTGNPAVIMDDELSKKSVTNLKGYLVNHGFFDASVDYEVETKGQKAFITYLINEREPYIMDTIYRRTSNEGIKEILKPHEKDSYLHVGDIYSQDNIIQERNRIEDLLKNNGFYMFSRSYINYIVFKDTAQKKVNVEEIIQRPTFAERHEPYTIDSINFRINPPSNEFIDRRVQKEYRGIDYSFYRDRYSEKIIASRILMEKDGLYNRQNAIETQRLLNSLDLFRFVNISFDTLGTSLTANIFTQPNQKYQLTNQLGLTITEQLPGPFFSTGLRNRNFFRAGEILEFNFRAGLEGVASATDQGVYQSQELNTSVSVIFPRFLIPFAPGALQKFGRYNPNTRVQFGYLHTNRPEYTRNSINGLLAYTWHTRNNRQSFTINAADINYIRTPKITPEFQQVLEDLQANGNNLIWSFLPSFVSSISGQTIINFNRYGDFNARKASLLRLFLESGGTTLNFTNIKSNDEPGIEFANFQWLKTQVDFRRYYPVNKKQTFAYRFNFGWSKPYGVSAGVLPYEKYFFAGGGTSIRAWQARRLGPGSYKPVIGEGGPYDYVNEQPAEMILESMLEYRRNLVGFFDMALFIDAGNSWMIGVDPARPGADFRWDRFYKEIALGAGIGLRMDFDFLVIRLDLATKAVDPAQDEGDRWVLDNVSFKRPFGARGQTVFNFGIGYPF